MEVVGFTALEAGEGKTDWKNLVHAIVQRFSNYGLQTTSGP
jgi:hypothetical protein